jgi:3-carboxy-cis,cis-muconate cycloisomerase
MALARHLGARGAHELVERASRRAAERGRHLRDVLAEDGDVLAHLSAADLDRLFDAAVATGAADELVSRALAARLQGG